ncbi:hypothetical protein AEST_09180 [Alishewanella aestuarii B11]|uniref:Uncharacterized protein n=1 Tax=Alishewanella aestuarii B11 TaxID=1197174 RepID=J2IG52_9ALTE|nr:hypothetical protein AEST_09180 [Alishewanella aestuarii B11]
MARLAGAERQDYSKNASLQPDYANQTCVGLRISNINMMNSSGSE